MSLISLRGVTRTLDDRVLFRDVDFTLLEGERVALLGANGSGKSTLVRVLCGREAPESGERLARRDLRLGWLEQEPELDPMLSTRDAVRKGLEQRARVEAELHRVHAELAEQNLERTAALLERAAGLEARLDELGGHDVEHRIESILGHLGLSDLDRRCGELSGGERRRVALARMLVVEPEVLVLDEPTNHLDAFAVEWLEDFLLSSQTTLFFVTHDRYVLERLAHRIVELENGSLYSYEGNYSDYVAQRMARLETQAQDEAARLNLLRRETTWIRRGAPARSTKQKARIARYAQLLDRAPAGSRADLELELPDGPRLGSKGILLDSVTKVLGDRTVLSDVSLELRAGERVGIVGRNGAGKSTLLRLIRGECSPDRGRIERGETVRMSEIDQDRSGLDPARTIQEELVGRNEWIRIGGSTQRLEGFLERFRFGKANKDTPVGALSGGERARLCIAKLLTQSANVLVLDEPTNDLDLPTLRSLEEALLEFRGAAVIVSHDRWFLDRVATRILVLDGSGGLREHAGDMAQIFARLTRDRDEERRRREDASAARRDELATIQAAPPKPRRLAPWQQRELDRITSELESMERDLAALDARLCDPTLYRGSAQTAVDVREERDALARRIEAHYARWQELEAPQ